MKITFDTNLRAKAEAACEVAARVAFAELNGRFQEAIGSRVWNWPRETERTAGGMVGSPRTIVDTGALRQSNVFTITKPLTGTFSWTTNYASFVHEGAMIFPWGDTRRKRVYTPPRPWTAAVLGSEQVAGIKPFDLSKRLKELVAAELNK